MTELTHDERKAYLMGRIDDVLADLPERLTPRTIEKSADVMRAVLAEIIAYQIDVGSERDAVNESEALHVALEAELMESLGL